MTFLGMTIWFRKFFNRLFHFLEVLNVKGICFSEIGWKKTPSWYAFVKVFKKVKLYLWHLRPRFTSPMVFQVKEQFFFLVRTTLHGRSDRFLQLEVDQKLAGQVTLVNRFERGGTKNVPAPFHHDGAAHFAGWGAEADRC